MAHLKLAVTIEENTVLGGFGSAILEMLARRGVMHPVLTLGIPDTILEHGTQTEQRKFLGIDGPGIPLVFAHAGGGFLWCVYDGVKLRMEFCDVDGKLLHRHELTPER